MNILSQILNLSSKNLLIDTLLSNFKSDLSKMLNNYTDSFTNDKFINIFFDLQSTMNNFITSFIIKFIEAIDCDFKNSKERKKSYYINKSVSRTIFTIFGEITFNRTLYINKFSREYYYYVDDVLNIEPYTTYDPIVKSILVNDSCLTNPNHTSINSSLYSLNLKNYLNNNSSIPRSTIYKFKKDTKIRKIDYDLIETTNTLYYEQMFCYFYWYQT